MRHLKIYRSPNEGGGTPPAGNNPPAPPAGSGNPPAPPAQDTQDVASLPEWAQKLVRDTREEAAKHRVNAKDRETLAAKLKAIEDAQLSETEKAKNRVTELETALNAEKSARKQALIEREIAMNARRLNLVDEEAALRLLDQNKIEFDGDNPKNIATLLEDLVKAKPYLRGTAGTSSTSATNGAASGGRRWKPTQI